MKNSKTTHAPAMILYIDATDFNGITYVLAGEKVFRMKYSSSPHESHKSLKNLEAFLKKIRRPAEAIKKIIVNKGPGSYTGTRVGIVHALALGLAWNVPVTALDKERFNKHLARSVSKAI